MIRVAPREMGHFSIRVKQTLTRIHEKSIYSLLNKTTDLPFVSPGIFWPIEPHVHHITLVKALLKKKGSGYANRPTPEFILINEGLIEIPSYNPRQIVELSDLGKIPPQNLPLYTSRTCIYTIVKIQDRFVGNTLTST